MKVRESIRIYYQYLQITTLHLLRSNNVYKKKLYATIKKTHIFVFNLKNMISVIEKYFPKQMV